MNRFVVAVLFNFLLVSNGFAASWTTLQDNKHAKLLLDKQSITESGKYQKAWVKINYKAMQTNIEYPEKSYNNAKLLWYFNCNEQKSATAQVYQLLNDEQVFSAAINVKRARFLEPVPETEIDIAMQYVCKKKAYEAAAKAKAEAAKIKQENEAAEKAKETDTSAEKKVTATAATKEVTAEPEGKPVLQADEETTVSVEDKEGDVKNSKKEEKHAVSGEESNKKEKKDKDKGLKVKPSQDSVDVEKQASSKVKKPKTVHWNYKGSKGPEFWGELSPDFVSCKIGRNQSPIDINKTITTAPKSLKTFQRFPAEDILNDGYTVQANFKTGNIMVVDSVMYQMKQVHFHAPSENTIMGKSFPLEAHFVHTDPKGNLAYLTVMYEEGAENKALAKLWQQMPKTKTKKAKKLKSKVLAGQLIPRKKHYYRFSGSLTTPPCSEGVTWIVMKEAMTVSTSQIEAFKKVMRHDNNRPVQPLNGRMVIE